MPGYHPGVTSHLLLRLLPCLFPCILALGMATAAAAPYTPASDSEVMERLPARATDPRAREMLALRQAWRAQPQHLPTALRLAARYQLEVAATGDPRFMGYAQAVLQPWWALPEPPPAVRVLRAVVLQFDHRFDPALADLAAALRTEPDNAAAWAWQTAIQMVRADYALARLSCEQLARLAAPLVGAACRAQVDAATGRAAAASGALRAALQAEAGADPALRTWSLTRLAEIDERRGDFAAAEAAFDHALATGEPDVYLLAAYADFLLEQDRAAEVVPLLRKWSRSDTLLLRLALAARALKLPEGEKYVRTLGERFADAALRGEKLHLQEEARYLLELKDDAPAALAAARENYRTQREPRDALVLLEAALAARDPAAAAPALQWLESSGFESDRLRRLALQLRAIR